MKALFAWPGGKSRLLTQLRARIPAHIIYAEVFAGSAKLLFAKDPSPCEIINDTNGDIANFYRTVKHRAAELAEALEHELLHPERFRELRSSNPDDELGRAIRFAYLTWHSYGSKGEHFAAASLGEALKGYSRRPLHLMRGLLEQGAERLQRVRIEQRDFADMLTRFDSPDTFFYLDPPYVDYQRNGRYDALTPERRDELFLLLAKLEGSFLLSFDDCEEIRALGDRHGFMIEQVSTTYGLGNTPASRGMRSELLLGKAA